MQSYEISDYALNNFSNKRMIDNYLQLYDENGYKQKILLIDVNCKYSSTGNIVYSLFKGLKDRGREAVICYGRGKNVKEEGIFKFGIDLETYLHAGLSRITGYNGSFSPISTNRLIKYIETFKPDVIHIHELHAYFINIAELVDYLKEKGIPVVWTFHCEYMYTGKCGHAYDCKKYMAECGKCPAVREYPKSLFFDRTNEMLVAKREMLKDFNFTIVTPSRWLANRVKTSFLKNKKIVVVNNGVDTNIFKPRISQSLRRKLGIPVTNKIVLAVAPDLMSERKGGKWVLSLAKSMSKEKVSFVMIGCKDTKKLMDNVWSIEILKDSEMLSRFYSLADVFVIFSKRETYSMTCAEALCCGTPVVGFKCGAPETVFEEPYAQFLDYGDIDAVRKLLENRKVV